jgi:hypothetical protein
MHRSKISHKLLLQKNHVQPVTTITPVNTTTITTTTTNQIQYISTTDRSSLSINRLSTGLQQPKWSPAMNIPCTTGIRLPNLTDCTRYYTCNVTSGITFSYTCPPQMAFNVYTHVCDTGIYKWCKEQNGTHNQPIFPPISVAVSYLTTPGPTSCSKPGKTPDPHSSKHYFVCYLQGDKIKTYRMACPNTLYYCALEEVCKKASDCSG